MNVNFMNEISANQTTILLLPLCASLRNQSLARVISTKILHHTHSTVCVYLKGNDLNLVRYDTRMNGISTA